MLNSVAADIKIVIDQQILKYLCKFNQNHAFLLDKFDLLSIIYVLCNFSGGYERYMSDAQNTTDEIMINENIKAKQVRLIDADNENRGIVSIKEALAIAEDYGLDLIEISPQANPPVCKVLDYGKFRYEQQKKKNEAKKNQKVVEIKELKLRPVIETHDYEVKMKQAKKFLEQGNKVKFTMRFKGRELSANDMGKQIMTQIVEDLDTCAKVDSEMKLEGRQMMMILSPLK